MSVRTRNGNRLTLKILNDDFQILRSNAIRRWNFRQDKFHGLQDDEDDDDGWTDDDRVGLLRQASDVENGVLKPNRSEKAPPPFVALGQSLVHRIGILNEKVKELDTLHRARAARPATFDDEALSGEEEKIDRLTKEIVSDISSCHHDVKQIRKSSRSGANLTTLESVIANNVVLGVSNSLQETTVTFQRSQNEYLKRIEASKAKSKMYFDDFEEINIESELQVDIGSDRKLNTLELLELEENTKFVQQREREINGIVKSISELNTIFKDLAQMVTDQGTIVDRIDHNIENTQIKVEAGLEQLKIAERHQSKNRKMYCIVILAVIVLFLLLILIIKIS